MIAAPAEGGQLMASYRRAFEHLGHETCSLSPLAAARGSRAPWFGLRHVPLANRIFSDQLVLEGNRVLTAEAIRWRPDVLLTGGADLLPGALATIKAVTGCQAVMVFPDTLINLQPTIIQALPIYDLVVYSCGEFGLSFLEQLGARKTAYLPFAWDKELHPRPAPTPVPSNTAFDVVFVGNWRPDREAWLEHLGPCRVGVWGSDYWRHRTAPGSVARRSWQRGLAEGSEFSQVAISAKINLNLVDVTNGPGMNMRAFELVGVGGFVLSNRTAAIEDLFVEGEHAAYFSSPEELREKVRYYLNHEAERVRISAAAARLADSNTYEHRVRQLLELVNCL